MGMLAPALLLTLVLAQASGGVPGADVPAPPEASALTRPPSRPLGLPEAREGSGTGWLPDSSPMYAADRTLAGWRLRLQGNGLLAYDWQGSDRGDDAILSLNWLRGTIRRPLFGGEIGARAMLSVEPLTVRGGGYPLLFQTGESFEGEALQDRQPPNDLFMELALSYSRELFSALAFQVYLAASGEPALGPVSYLHRLSAFTNPLAPVGHRWQDSTDVAFGVLTAGLFTRFAKLEGSWFNGREPDEDRWNLDLRWPDSWSLRLWIQPLAQLNAQVSYGDLHNPDLLRPGGVRRLTASVTWNQRLILGNWAATFAWGRNWTGGRATDALLLEGSLDLEGHLQFFGRVEWARKSGAELALPGLEERTFRGFQGTLGAAYLFGPFTRMMVGAGAAGTLYRFAPGLEPFYGTRTALGGLVFIQVRPAMALPFESLRSQP